MNEEMLQAAVGLPRPRYVLVATADETGLPHLAVAGELTAVGPGRVEVTEWFCPGTIANVEENRQLSITVWNPEMDEGFQMLGVVESVEGVAVMDGYAPEAEPEEPLPQVERRLVVTVEQILHFTQGPHSDQPE